MAEKLRPCPFCGGEAHIREVVSACSVVYTVGCSDSECMGFETLLCKTTPEEAIAAWNCRAERTCGEWRGDPRQDAIGHAAAHEDDELWCENCDIELDEDWEYCPHCGARVVSE